MINELDQTLKHRNNKDTESTAINLTLDQNHSTLISQVGQFSQVVIQ